MGSAESSTLQSVECLSASLDEINRKLIIIEDIHLHHDRVHCTDETILVYGKRVKCSSIVDIVIGPVVGLVGTNFITFMLEINRAASLTILVFTAENDLGTETKFHSSKVCIANCTKYQ